MKPDVLLLIAPMAKPLSVRSPLRENSGTIPVPSVGWLLRLLDKFPVQISCPEPVDKVKDPFEANSAADV